MFLHHVLSALFFSLPLYHLKKVGVLILMIRMCDTWTTNLTSYCLKGISVCENNFSTELVGIAGLIVESARACGFHQVRKCWLSPCDIVLPLRHSETLLFANFWKMIAWNFKFGPQCHFTSSLPSTAPFANLRRRFGKREFYSDKSWRWNWGS